MSSDKEIAFLQWALPRLGYRWHGFRKPRGQVLKRIRNRLQELELTGEYDEYKTFLENHPEEWNHLDRLCYATISKFFRDRKLWEYLRDYLLPELLATEDSGTIEIWSAGSCNGEEPYSIAIAFDMVMNEQKSDRTATILATDRYPEMLERAKLGIYPAGALKEMKTGEIDFYFTKTGNRSDKYEINREITQMVEFEQRDIRTSIPDQLFDLVFCRNLVFTYFSDKHQEQFLRQLKSHINQDRYLIIGSNETLPPVNWLKRTSKSFPVYRARSVEY